MKAMILAAGFGTRLRPLTHSRPKALVPVGNRPLLEHAISYLASFGVTQVMVNAHHHWSQVKRYLNNFSLEGSMPEIHLSMEEEILGTGGAIKKVQDFWDQRPFLLFNVDVLTNIDLKAAWEAHLKTGAMATLVVHDHPRFNMVKVDDDLWIKGFHQSPKPGLLAFTGIHVIDPRLLDLIPPNRFCSIIECYRCAIAKGLPIRAHYTKGIKWADVGTIASYVEANKACAGGSGCIVGEGGRIHPSAEFEGWCVIGRACKIHKGAHVEGSILWDNVEVLAERKVIKSIVTDSKAVERDLRGEIL